MARRPGLAAINGASVCAFVAARPRDCLIDSAHAAKPSGRPSRLVFPLWISDRCEHE
jgi:hypothetical protein